MTITQRVQQAFFAPTTASQELIRLPPTVVVQYNITDTNPWIAPRRRASARPTSRRKNLWSVEEHERFLRGLELFPQGPWKDVAAIVGTKNTRQTMTHAQKYRQKIQRRLKKHHVTREEQGDDYNPIDELGASFDEGKMELSVDRDVLSLEELFEPMAAVSSPVDVASADLAVDTLDFCWVDHDFAILMEEAAPAPFTFSPYVVAL